jgi:hypothetical protein
LSERWSSDRFSQQRIEEIHDDVGIHRDIGSSAQEKQQQDPHHRAAAFALRRFVRRGGLTRSRFRLFQDIFLEFQVRFRRSGKEEIPLRKLRDAC